MELDLTRLAESGADEDTLRLVEKMVLQEKERQRQRQRDGIAAAKARGVRFGRPAAPLPPNFEDIVTEWENKHITTKTAMRLCSMSEATFLRKAREFRRKTADD